MCNFGTVRPRMSTPLLLRVHRTVPTLVAHTRSLLRFFRLHSVSGSLGTVIVFTPPASPFPTPGGLVSVCSGCHLFFSKSPTARLAFHSQCDEALARSVSHRIGLPVSDQFPSLQPYVAMRRVHLRPLVGADNVFIPPSPPPLVIKQGSYGVHSTTPVHYTFYQFWPGCTSSHFVAACCQVSCACTCLSDMLLRVRSWSTSAAAMWTLLPGHCPSVATAEIDFFCA